MKKKKWKASNDGTKDIMGHTKTRRLGFDNIDVRLCLNALNGEHREMVIQESRETEDGKIPEGCATIEARAVGGVEGGPDEVLNMGLQI